MATETERKFLVKGEFINKAVKAINITQTYITIDPHKTVRLRFTDDEAYLTIKSPQKTGSLGRGEWEYIIPVEDARDMLSLCLPGKVIKTRYHVPFGEHTFEVDVFHGQNEGLVIAELELSSDDEKFTRPEWLGEEVTGDPRYYSSNLIK